MKRRDLLNRPEEEAEINLTPMLDIVFIMLIFFIVTSSFVSPSSIDVTTPVAQSAEQTSNNAVLLSLSADGSVQLNGQASDVRLIKAKLIQLKQQQPQLAVLVQADQQSSTGQLVAVLDQLRLAKVPYSLAAQASQP
ncbi:MULTISPECIES: ExbD/TolR family protein [unclassified Agarivorans]|uniref:ExbD/TolR family protein n=1 Tax=unclassified Agarivorans TaxID=2636026 RepID=UPI0026E3B4BD|nr:MULTISPECIES: biopolymer transporter ExbD [unclassified Agarivorans]MDO6685315.1 biopolymer transporter ExbD [Agarivorans sp. 3_MG-2023]MDO6715513.1 biopolymer transporter ExbD [Agarivorans sp. 2_MG-2023]